jgi:hypothetical protein
MEALSKDFAAEHLEFCRKLRQQLWRIADSPQEKREVPDITVPVNLERLVNEVDQYIGWVETSKGQIEGSLRMSTP